MRLVETSSSTYVARIAYVMMGVGACSENLSPGGLLDELTCFFGYQSRLFHEHEGRFYAEYPLTL